MFPAYWQAFLEANDLVGTSACLDEQDDLSGLGASMQFLDQAQSSQELTECWPGIVVARHGYVPVAWCSLGSGDYYYINRNDGPDGAMYRIYHDAIGETGDDPTGVVVVLARYATVLAHLDR